MTGSSPHSLPSNQPDPPNDENREELGATANLSEATVDLGRRARCGFGEVIYGEGKSTDLIKEIIEAQQQAGQSSLVTRIAPADAEVVGRTFDHTRVHPIARTLRVGQAPLEGIVSATAGQPHVAVVSAGSTDAPVAEEAVETLAWMGVPTIRFTDIGVAGPQRLQMAVPELRKASALVVVAGMEGALPSVIGGHITAPIFAVPTSVGYGANLGGVTALLGMLTSCAAGVAVVNIDAGFKGGYLAGMVVNAIERANASAPKLTR